MKECNLDCSLQHEGYCTLEIQYGINPETCKAKTNEDLEEIEEEV